MNRNIDLTKVNPNCMSLVIEHNINEIYACTSVADTYVYVSNLFKEHNLNTNASRRLLENIQKSKTLISAQYTITNSLLAGSGLSVN